MQAEAASQQQQRTSSSVEHANTANGPSGYALPSVYEAVQESFNEGTTLRRTAPNSASTATTVARTSSSSIDNPTTSTGATATWSPSSRPQSAPQHDQQQQNTPPNGHLTLPHGVAAAAVLSVSPKGFVRHPSNASFAEVLAQFSGVRTATATPSTPIAKAGSVQPANGAASGGLRSPAWSHLHPGPFLQQQPSGESPMHQTLSSSMTAVYGGASMTVAKCVNATNRHLGDIHQGESPQGRTSVVSRHHPVSGSVPLLQTAPLQVSQFDGHLSSPMLSASLHRAKLGGSASEQWASGVPAFVDQGFDIAAAIDRMGRVNAERARMTDARLLAIEHLVTTLIDNGSHTTSDMPATAPTWPPSEQPVAARDDSWVVTATCSGSSDVLCVASSAGCHRGPLVDAATPPVVVSPRRRAKPAAALPWSTLRSALLCLIWAIVKKICGWLPRGVVQRWRTMAGSGHPLVASRASVDVQAALLNQQEEEDRRPSVTTTSATQTDELEEMAWSGDAGLLDNPLTLRLPRVLSTPLTDSDPSTTNTNTQDDLIRLCRRRQFSMCV